MEDCGANPGIWVIPSLKTSTNISTWTSLVASATKFEARNEGFDARLGSWLQVSWMEVRPRKLPDRVDFLILFAPKKPVGFGHIERKNSWLFPTENRVFGSTERKNPLKQCFFLQSNLLRMLFFCWFSSCTWLQKTSCFFLNLPILPTKLVRGGKQIWKNPLPMLGPTATSATVGID